MVRRCLPSRQRLGRVSLAEGKACAKAQKHLVKMPIESWVKVEWKLKRGAVLSEHRKQRGHDG